MSDFRFDSGKSNSSGQPVGIGATIFLMLFATPFAAAGTFTLVQGVKKWLTGDVQNGPMLCLFGLVFSTVGYGLIAVAVWARRNGKKTAALQAQYAGRPWMIRPDWAAGKIKSTAMGQSAVYLIMALGFCGIGGISALVSLPGELQKHNYAALLILLFPAVGLCFFAAFVSAWLSRMRYGQCFFELAQVPIPLGGTLAGMIQTGARLKLQHGLHLKSSCIRRVVSGSGKNRSVNESVLWQDEMVFRPDAILPEPEPGHTGIPVYFKLPGDQPQCFKRGDVSVYWRLEARAKMAGPDFAAVFDVPVFHVDGAVPVPADEADPTAALQMPIADVRRDEHSRIKVSDGPGGREFYFPAARNPGTALFTSVMAVILDGGTCLAVHFGLFILFPILMSLFGILISCFAFSLWFKSSRVTINPSGVQVMTRYLLFGRTRQYSTGDIASFQTSPGMTSGSHVYLDIRLVPQTGNGALGAVRQQYPETGQQPALKFQISDPRGIPVASNIASEVEAKWLAQQMNQALGRAHPPF